MGTLCAASSCRSRALREPVAGLDAASSAVVNAVSLLDFHTRLSKLLKMILATLVMLPNGLKQPIQIILMFGLSRLDQGIGQVGTKG